jgi:glycosyltransferase involved in cell wall biosynthesis
MNIKVGGLNKIGGVGGGGTFTRNFIKALSGSVNFTDFNSCDVYFIPGATMVDKEEVREAKKQNKKIVLRVDNYLEDSKNRNSGMSRLIEFSKIADRVIYQSNWSRKILKCFCGDGDVILNAVDTDIFFPDKEIKEKKKVFYSKFSRNESKNFHEVIGFWRDFNLPKVKEDWELVFVGRFSDEIRKINHPFEFHNKERFSYLGVLDACSIAQVLRGCCFAYLPYYNDACSNTILECQACNVPVIHNGTGGNNEIVVNGFVDRGSYYFKDVEELIYIANHKRSEFCFDNFKSYFGLERMAEEYLKVFSLLTII